MKDNYTFELDEHARFSKYSSVYKVFKNNHLVTAVVIGYNCDKNHWYITLLGDNPLRRYYDLAYDNISWRDFLNILVEVKNLASILTPEYICDDYYSIKNRFDYNNLLYYMGDTMIDRAPENRYYLTPKEFHSFLGVQTGIFQPIYLENYHTLDLEDEDNYDVPEIMFEEYIDITPENLEELFQYNLYDPEFEVGANAFIDFDVIEQILNQRVINK